MQLINTGWLGVLYPPAEVLAAICVQMATICAMTAELLSAPYTTSVGKSLADGFALL